MLAVDIPSQVGRLWHLSLTSSKDEVRALGSALTRGESAISSMRSSSGAPAGGGKKPQDDAL